MDVIRNTLQSFEKLRSPPLTCSRQVLEAGRPDHGPVDVLGLCQRLLHLVHVAEDASDHGQQEEPDQVRRLGPRVC